jgi:hypothetical protein
MEDSSEKSATSATSLIVNDLTGNMRSNRVATCSCFCGFIISVTHSNKAMDHAPSRHVNDSVNFVLALPLAHLWMHLWVDRAGGARHSLGMTQKSSDEARRPLATEQSVSGSLSEAWQKM